MLASLRPCLFLIWLAVAASAWAQVPEGDEGDKLSRFQRTIAALQESPPAEIADFSAVALVELAAVYMAEADLARSESESEEGSKRGRLLAWSLAVDQYASQLILVLEDVEQGFPISLRGSQLGPATVTVADRAVMLGHPRADQQAAYEQRVLADFCSGHDCQRMTITESIAIPIPISAQRVSPLWTFAASGPVCSHGGLEVHFRESAELASARSICEELMLEAATLAIDLAWQRRHGVEIEWDALSITGTPGRPEHLVRLNTAGDSVLLTVPLFFGSPDLLLDIRPWLDAQVRGSDLTPVRLSAADYGWLGTAGSAR